MIAASFMCKSIISACKALDEMGLPGAVGKLDTDRFLLVMIRF
jgi:hypothetical protein